MAVVAKHWRTHRAELAFAARSLSAELESDVSFRGFAARSRIRSLVARSCKFPSGIRTTPPKIVLHPNEFSSSWENLMFCRNPSVPTEAVCNEKCGFRISFLSLTQTHKKFTYFDKVENRVPLSLSLLISRACDANACLQCPVLPIANWILR